MGAIAAGINYLSQRETNDTMLDMNRATNRTNKDIADSTNQANKELAEQQNQWNIEQWNRENEYNDPRQQAARLQGAGLSAAAAAQSVSNVPAASIQSADLANQQVGNPMESPSGLQAPMIDPNSINPLQLFREMELLKQETIRTDDMEIENKHRERKVLTDLDVKDATVRSMNQEMQQSAEMFPHKKESIIADINLKRQQHNFYDVYAEEKRVNNEKLRQEVEFAKDIHFAEMAKYGQELRNLIEQEMNIRADTNLKKKNTQVAEEQRKNIAEDTEKKKEEKFSVKLDNVAKKYGDSSSTSLRIAAMCAEGLLKPEDIPNVMNGIKSYYENGSAILNRDVNTRNYFNYVLDEGAAALSGRGLLGLGLSTSGAGSINKNLIQKIDEAFENLIK